MQQTTRDQLLFIAELLGFKTGTVEDKVNFGLKCYAHQNYHSLDLSNEEDRKDLHENIWLERIYNELDQVHGVNCPTSRALALSMETISDSYQWSVPIECDASASMLQYEGALLGDSRLLNMTNCIVGSEGLIDPWGTIPGVPREAVKKRFTPSLYGSNQTANEFLKRAKFSSKEISTYVPLILAEEQHGAFGLANGFKDFIINNVNPQETMEVHIWNEKFTIQCNRFKRVGEYSKFYKVYDSYLKRNLVFKNTHTKNVADLKQFRRYFVTLLI